MDRNYAAAKHREVRLSNQLMLSFPPCPVGHFGFAHCTSWYNYYDKFVLDGIRTALSLVSIHSHLDPVFSGHPLCPEERERWMQSEPENAKKYICQVYCFPIPSKKVSIRLRDSASRPSLFEE